MDDDVREAELRHAVEQRGYALSGKVPATDGKDGYAWAIFDQHHYVALGGANLNAIEQWLAALPERLAPVQGLHPLPEWAKSSDPDAPPPWHDAMI
jgi:hypothetical protein